VTSLFNVIRATTASLAQRAFATCFTNVEKWKCGAHGAIPTRDLSLRSQGRASRTVLLLKLLPE
jgi:hypothetical protein